MQIKNFTFSTSREQQEVRDCEQVRLYIHHTVMMMMMMTRQKVVNIFR